MPRVQASIILPYRLKLEAGVYPIGLPDQELVIQEVGPRVGKASTLSPLLTGPVSGSLLPFGRRTKTVASLIADLPDTEDPDEQSGLNAKLAGRLLLLTNRVLRSYRAIARDATMTELTLAEASPFRFAVVAEAGRPVTWRSEIVYQATPPKPPAQTTRRITERLRDLLASGDEPEVADLFLLDAELAIHEGRFREAVLFCWSTIDATFNRKYDQLVDSRLAGEWAEARSFFKGLDFRL